MWKITKQFAVIFCCMILVFLIYKMPYPNIFSIGTNFIDLFNASDDNTANELTCIKTKTLPSFHICPYNASIDIYISNALLFDGVWEPKMTMLFQKILSASSNVTVIDIGANIGYFTILGATMGAHVIAVEPIKQNLRRLSRAVLLNNLNNKIIILNYAISNVKGIVYMGSSKTNQGAARILTSYEMQFADDKTAVEAITMDELVQFAQTRDIIIKLDVEGYECLIMEGCSSLLDSYNVLYIFMEWGKMTSMRNKDGVACSADKIRKMAYNLYQHGFVPYDANKDKRLDINSCDRWRTGDVYWKKHLQ